MNPIYCITTVNQLGCTFIDWSVYFLSGRTNFYNVKQQEFLPLTNNPLTSINAHAHKKNHPDGYKNTVKMIEHLKSLSGKEFHSIYPFYISLETILKSMEISPADYAKEVNRDFVDKAMNDDYQALIEYNLAQDNKVIYIKIDPRFIHFNKAIRSSDRFIFQSQWSWWPKSPEDMAVEFNEVWHADSIQTWNKFELNNVWDMREKDALNFNLHQPPLPELNYSDKNWFYLNSMDFWFSGDRTMVKIMDFLEQKILSEKFEQWLPIYKLWQDRNASWLDFCIHLDHIIDSIVHGYNYKLPELTYRQEVIIQHLLLYCHNLNLKTWQLKKFPNNTLDLHGLLEPNTHVLTPRSYIKA